MNGLHPHTIARTVKLSMLPATSPTTMQKPAITAATSTSSLRPFSRGLCSSDGAAIWHNVDTNPLLSPKANNSNMNNTSELMRGGVEGEEESR